MDRRCIKDVKIEPRGELGVKNITMFLEPEKGDPAGPTYSALVELAEAVFRDALRAGAEGYVLTNADVMSWSDRNHLGMYTAYRYRVTADFCPFNKLNDHPEYD